MEIGSIYEVNPALAEAGSVDGEPAEDLFLAGIRKYGKEHCVYTASCREAIALALKSLGQHRERIPKRCLLPAYMCDSVFIPFERAGWELYFYHIDKELAASEEELRRLVDGVRPGLLFIHPYYGVDTWKAMRPLLLEWKTRGICIMEDVTQSYYLEGAGAEADYVVGSLRKWYPVPDGGFVASDQRISGDGLEAPAAYVQMRLEALEEKWRYLNGAESGRKEGLEEKDEIKLKFLKKNRAAEEELDRYSGISRLSGTAARILKETDEEEAKVRRSENYRYLYGKLCGNTQFAPILRMREKGEGAGTEMECEQGENACIAPLYFAVYAQEREKLQEYLREREIFAPVLWPAGKENGGCLSEDEAYIYGHMLAIPMDQRYGMEEMRRIVEVMEEYERLAVGILGREESKAIRQMAEVQGQEEYSSAGQKADTPRKEEGGKIEWEKEISGEENRSSAMQVIGIRADANGTVATGHIMRCITIAKQLKRKGSRVVFFTADEYGRGWLEQAGMDMVCLQSEWNDMESEIPQLRRELKKAGCKKLLVDSYQVSADYFGKLRDLCKLAYIDDCFDGVYPVDMLVNYNAYYVRFPYREVYMGKTRLLLGTSYVPLREEFWRRDAEAAAGQAAGEGTAEEITPRNERAGRGIAEKEETEEEITDEEAVGREADEKKIVGMEETGKEQAVGSEGAEKGTAGKAESGKEPSGEEKIAGKAAAGKRTVRMEESRQKIKQAVQHVIISSGGGDRYNALLGILAGAMEDAGLREAVFHTVVGKFHNSKEQLERLAAEHQNIRLHEDVRDMAGLMASCCAAVSAAGTMLFELSAIGIPAVFFVSADNQQYDSEFFAVEDRMLFAGDIRADRARCIREICSGLKKILGDAKLQARMQEALHRVTDGRGAERIAQAILEL